jgi:hypothetical protein
MRIAKRWQAVQIGRFKSQREHPRERTNIEQNLRKIKEMLAPPLAFLRLRRASRNRRRRQR